MHHALCTLHPAKTERHGKEGGAQKLVERAGVTWGEGLEFASRGNARQRHEQAHTVITTNPSILYYLVETADQLIVVYQCLQAKKKKKKKKKRKKKIPLPPKKPPSSTVQFQLLLYGPGTCCVPGMGFDLLVKLRWSKLEPRKKKK